MDFCSLQVCDGQSNVIRAEFGYYRGEYQGTPKHYMTHANGDDTSIVGHYKAEDLHSGPGYFSVSWSDLYDVFNLDALDISLIRCLTLWVYIAQKIVHCHF